MSGNLTTRVEKLETKAGITAAFVPKLVRLCVSDADVAAAYKEAERLGLDREGVMIIQLVPLTPREPRLPMVE